MEIKPRAKYRVVGSRAKKTTYRTRTGPRCCGPNCPAKKSKRTKLTRSMF